MQIPQDSGSPQPYYAPDRDPHSSSSPYPPPPPPPYQHQYSPPNHSYQPPYGQSPHTGQQYGQPGYSPYAAPPQRSYAPLHGASSPSEERYGYETHHQSQYGPPRPSHSPYQQQGGYYPPGPPPPAQYGSAASYMNYDQEGPGQPSVHVPPPTETRPEDDRGVLGALAGGATGAWAGHKVNHGFLGALGGAFAGHKLQDAVSDHKKHKDDKKHSPSPPPPPPKPQQGLPAHHDDRRRHHYAGNFTASSTQMSIDKDYDLIASCRRIDGTQRLSAISLNDCLTNTDGHLRWAKGGFFGGSARNVRLVDGGRTLEAELRNCAGAWVWDRIALDERIGNENGDLVFVQKV